MSSMVFYDTFPLPEVSVKEVLRYAGTNESDQESLSLLNRCIEEANVSSGKVAYCTLPVKRENENIDFESFKTSSKLLSKFFENTDETILFAATIGIEFDRLIAKYSLLSPAKALMLQALGSERVEALCDTFSHFIQKKYGAKSVKRFSPGYGDLPLSLQKEIIPLLEANKKCGIYVGEHFLLSPSKTVTAFIKMIQNEE